MQNKQAIFLLTLAHHKETLASQRNFSQRSNVDLKEIKRVYATREKHRKQLICDISRYMRIAFTKVQITTNTTIH